MFKKEVILANFIKHNNVLSYLEKIHNEYGIAYRSIFVYNIDGNKSEYLVTFKIDANGKDIVNEIDGSTIFHYKNRCLFSINALNKLILSLCKDIEKTNEYKLDWTKYEDKLITVSGQNISIKNIKKINDYNELFQF